MKKLIFFLIINAFLAALVFSDAPIPVPADSLARLQQGMMLYGQGKWREAAAELEPLENAPNKTLAGEALFWIGMASLSVGEYEKAVTTFDAMETADPGSLRISETRYHKGRAFYHLGRYDEAILLLKQYADSFNIDSALSSQDISKKAAALYWVGESLFAMGQLDAAGDVFLHITSDYPQNAKYEAASYRIALINQKKIEAELLELLKWSHEESLRIMEEYQRRERAYDQAILSYQKRINDMLKDTRLADLETANTQYQQQLSVAEDRIRDLESKLSEAVAAVSVPAAVENSTERLAALRTAALEIRDEIRRSLDEVSVGREAER